MLKVKQWILLIVFSCSCPSQKHSNDSIQNEDDCEKAEARLLELKCKDSKGGLVGGPTSDGKKYSQFCKEKIAQGFNLNPGCISMISICEERDSCR